MAPRLLHDIASNAWGEHLAPLKPRGGRKGAGRREGKAGVAFTLLSTQISSHLTTTLNISTQVSWRHMRVDSQLPSLQPAIKPSVINFLWVMIWGIPYTFEKSRKPAASPVSTHCGRILGT